MKTSKFLLKRSKTFILSLIGGFSVGLGIAALFESTILGIVLIVIGLVLFYWIFWIFRHSKSIPLFCFLKMKNSDIPLDMY